MEEEPFSPLPAEIWVEIFHKLPLIFVVGRCSLVCKQWRRLISEPSFASNYNPNYSIPNHPPSLLLKDKIGGNDLKCIIDADGGSRNFCTVGRRYPFRCEIFRTSSAYVSITVVGSCNGLVALYRRAGEFLLFNPCTKAEKWVRAGSAISHPDVISWMSRFCGLFHDPAHDEYKVIMSNNATSCFVLSLCDGTFKFKTPLQNLDYIISSSVATLVKGVPHWAGHFRYKGTVVIYLDLLSEELRMVRFPDLREVLWAGFGCDQVGLRLGALDGQLVMTVQVRKFDNIDVWSLREYRNEPSDWSKLFVIANFQPCPGPGPCPPIFLVQILSQVSEDEILIYATEGLMMYSIRNRSWRYLLSFHGLPYHQIVSYIPSLVSPS